MKRKLAEFVESDDTLTYFDNQSKVLDCDVFRVNLSQPKEKSFLYDSSVIHELMAAEQALILSRNDGFVMRKGDSACHISPEMRVAVKMAVDSLLNDQPHLKNVVSCDSFAYFKHRETSDHTFVLPEVPRQYASKGYGKNTPVTMTPIVHEFLRRCIVHLRNFCKMRDGVSAPIDVPCNLAPLLVVGKSLSSMDSACVPRLEKMIVLMMSMYTNGVIPSVIRGIWMNGDKPVKNMNDSEAFMTIYNMIDSVIIDDVCGKDWCSSLFYHSKMEKYYCGARLAGCESLVVDYAIPKVAYLVDYSNWPTLNQSTPIIDSSNDLDADDTVTIEKLNINETPCRNWGSEDPINEGSEQLQPPPLPPRDDVKHGGSAVHVHKSEQRVEKLASYARSDNRGRGRGRGKRGRGGFRGRREKISA
jgi:hypothetical protein